MRQIFAAVLAAVLLTGCQSTAVAPPAAVPVAASFDSKEASFIKRKGSGTIEGHAFLKQKTGGTINAAGEVVRLIPSTSYARERFARLYGEARYVPLAAYPKAQSTDPQYVEFTRTTKAESNGRFTFENVAPGTYFVTTQITWQKEGALFAEGGAVYETVTLTGKETEPVALILSGN